MWQGSPLLRTMAYCLHSRVLLSSNNNTQCERKLVRLRMKGLTLTYDVVAGAVSPLLPSRVGRYKTTKWGIWIARDLANAWLMNSLWKPVRLCMMSTSNVTWLQCCALALLQLFVLGLNARGAQKRDWSSLFWDDSGGGCIILGLFTPWTAK
jgi:hypothetical protein